MIKDVDGKYVKATLTNALFIPSYPQNIFSVQAATDKGASVTFQPNSAMLMYKNKSKIKIVKRGRLYYIQTYDIDNVDSVKYACDLKQWHEILGHCNYEDVIQLETVVEGMKIKGAKIKPDDCSVCTEGKMTNNRNRKPDNRASEPLELVHSDLSGPIDPVSTEGYKYAISFTDDYSGVVFIYFLKNKSDTVEATEKFLADTANIGKVKCIRSDMGTEYTSSAFQTLLRKNQIKHETSAPYSPHQNGTAERQWRTVFEMGRCLLAQAKLSKPLWPYAVMAAAYIRNRCFNKRLKETPYFAMTGKRPDISNMRVFGSECYPYRQVKQKLDPRCTKGIFIGYDKYSPAYLVYNPETGKIMKHRLVQFPTRIAIDQHTQTQEIANDLDELLLKRPISVNNGNGDDRVEDTLSDTAENDTENESTAEAESSDENKRYPKRTKKRPAYLSDYVSGNPDEDQIKSNIDYCYKMSNFPQNYEEAVQSPEANHWKIAMEEEMSSLKRNDTFTLTPLPPGESTVGGRWVYTIKEGSDGEKTYKARYVAKGYSQVKGVNYDETFAPTANLTSIRVLMQIAAQYDLILHQMDVKSAYLNAPIDCILYMEQAEGFQVNSEVKLVYKLNKSLYGLKQSGRNWNNMLHTYLLENNFVQNAVDHCIYTMKNENEMVIILVWVDDLIIAATNDELLSKIKQMLNDKFHMKDLGTLSYFLGISFEQGEGYVKMNQTKYLLKILEKFEM